MGPISFYLGLKVDKDCEKRPIKLSQPAYIHKVLIKYYFDKTNPTNMQIKEVTLGLNLFTRAIQTEKKRYHGITGSFMFLMIETRLDIAF